MLPHCSLVISLKKAVIARGREKLEWLPSPLLSSFFDECDVILQLGNRLVASLGNAYGSLCVPGDRPLDENCLSRNELEGERRVERDWVIVVV